MNDRHTLATVRRLFGQQNLELLAEQVAELRAKLAEEDLLVGLTVDTTH